MSSLVPNGTSQVEITRLFREVAMRLSSLESTGARGRTGGTPAATSAPSAGKGLSAATALASVGGSAAAASEELALIADAGCLTRGKKPQAIQAWNDLSGTQAFLEAWSAASGVSCADFSTAMTNLGNLLSSLSPAWDDVTSDTTIDASAWSAAWKAAFNERVKFMMSASGRFPRKTSTFTTGSLASGATENMDVALAKTARLYRLSTDRPARVRLYSTAALRTEDANRVYTTPPPIGVCRLQATTDAAHLSCDLQGSEFFNLDTPPSTTCYLSVTNLGSAGTVSVTLVYQDEEA